MELVALVRHRHGVDDLAIRARAGLDVDHCQGVRFRKIGAEQQSVSEVLRRSFHRQLWRRVEGRIRSHCHWSSSLFASPDGHLPWGLCILSKPEPITSKARELNARGLFAPQDAPGHSGTGQYADWVREASVAVQSPISRSSTFGSYRGTSALADKGRPGEVDPNRHRSPAPADFWWLPSLQFLRPLGHLSY